jgi:hypothetical protein
LRFKSKNKIMSGGHWEYLQYRLEEVSSDMLKMVEKNGQLKSQEELKEERWNDDAWYEKYPEEKSHYKYPDEVIEEFKKGADIIKKAQTYMQRLDWLLSGDDGEDSFLSRLKDDLEKLI